VKCWQVQRPLFLYAEDDWVEPSHVVLTCTEIIDGTIFYNVQRISDHEIEVAGDKAWRLLSFIVEAMEWEWEHNMATGRL
jgi:hypothetical protein